MRCAGDLFARLAIVPMSQEARGLDAGKRLAEKLVGWGDNRTAAIVHRIAVEERNHVAVGGNKAIARDFWCCITGQTASTRPEQYLRAQALQPEGPWHHLAGCK